jgi:predicted nucleotidyltransferase
MGIQNTNFIHKRKMIKLYIFGSYLFSENPNDLDLLILYEKDKYSPQNIINYCKFIKGEFNRVINIPIHITALSLNEGSKFLIDSNAIKFDTAIKKNKNLIHHLKESVLYKKWIRPKKTPQK